MTVDEVRAERCIVEPPFYDAIDNATYIEFLEKVLREIARNPNADARAAIGANDGTS